MTLTRSAFNLQCIDLINRSRLVEDYGWELLQHRRGSISICNETLEDPSNSEAVLFLSKKVIYHKDNRILTDDYNVIYSDSYEVPVLYFNSSDKEGCPVAIENWDTDQGPAITQVEHPYSFRPVYMLHPCRTKDLMGLVVLDQNAARRAHYLLTWLSTIACCTKLDLDERLFN